MEIIEAIKNRKSIRKFQNKEINKEIISNILKAGISAPSPKNQQPWKFVVINGSAKEDLINVINTGIENVKKDLGIALDMDSLLSSFKITLNVIKEAPVIIFLINTNNKGSFNYATEKRTPLRRFLEYANIQSAGAVVENMLLASMEYGIGGLWMSDIYFINDEISEWLNTKKQVIAAVALGYPADDPEPRQKKGIDELVEWRWD